MKTQVATPLFYLTVGCLVETVLSQWNSNCISDTAGVCRSDSDCSEPCASENRGAGRCGPYRSAMLCYCDGTPGCPALSAQVIGIQGAVAPLTISATVAPAQPAAALSSRSIAWNGNWAFACDFLGGDLAKAETTADQCGPTCEGTPECTHFTYYPVTQRGCWLKKGSVTKADAHGISAGGVVCGIMENGPVKIVKWNGNNWAFGCDFPGGSLTDALTSGAECGGTCAATPGCTHFTWTPDSRTCHMKQGLVTQQDAVVVANQQIVCGIL